MKKRGGKTKKEEDKTYDISHTKNYSFVDLIPLNEENDDFLIPALAEKNRIGHEDLLLLYYKKHSSSLQIYDGYLWVQILTEDTMIQSHKQQHFKGFVYEKNEELKLNVGDEIEFSSNNIGRIVKPYGREWDCSWHSMIMPPSSDDMKNKINKIPKPIGVNNPASRVPNERWEYMCNQLDHFTVVYNEWLENAQIWDRMPNAIHCNGVVKELDSGVIIPPEIRPQEGEEAASAKLRSTLFHKMTLAELLTIWPSMSWIVLRTRVGEDEEFIFEYFEDEFPQEPVDHPSRCPYICTEGESITMSQHMKVVIISNVVGIFVAILLTYYYSALKDWKLFDY